MCLALEIFFLVDESYKKDPRTFSIFLVCSRKKEEGKTPSFQCDDIILVPENLFCVYRAFITGMGRNILRLCPQRMKEKTKEQREGERE